MVFASAAAAATPFPQVISADNAKQCNTALRTARRSTSIGGLTFPLNVFSWNVHKVQQPAVLNEFAELANTAHLMFVQEAVPSRQLPSLVNEALFPAFAAGYVQNGTPTGVLTLSRTSHLVHCRLLSLEPWLRTPKATSVTLYPLIDRQERLLAINIHAINFTLGVSDYQNQLAALTDLITAHEGPIIFGGDLNSWSPARQQVLQHFTSRMGLVAVPFDPDHRVTVFGRPLDHLYVRGLTWGHTTTHKVTTSDHNPLLATLLSEDS
jgi:endonuclease/exonuclease/phosphatase (EEP) superfamily protein YafD